MVKEAVLSSIKEYIWTSLQEFDDGKYMAIYTE